MFASGNNTERKRMGDIKAKDEFVCDLYAVRIIFILDSRVLVTSLFQLQ